MPWTSILKCQECGEYRVEMRRCEQQDASKIHVIQFCLGCGLEWWETYIKTCSELDNLKGGVPCSPGERE